MSKSWKARAWYIIKDMKGNIFGEGRKYLGKYQIKKTFTLFLVKKLNSNSN